MDEKKYLLADIKWFTTSNRLYAFYLSKDKKELKIFNNGKIIKTIFENGNTNILLTLEKAIGEKCVLLDGKTVLNYYYFTNAHVDEYEISRLMLNMVVDAKRVKKLIKTVNNNKKKMAEEYNKQQN